MKPVQSSQAAPDSCMMPTWYPPASPRPRHPSFGFQLAGSISLEKKGCSRKKRTLKHAGALFVVEMGAAGHTAAAEEVRVGAWETCSVRCLQINLLYHGQSER